MKKSKNWKAYNKANSKAIKKYLKQRTLFNIHQATSDFYKPAHQAYNMKNYIKAARLLYSLSEFLRGLGVSKKRLALPEKNHKLYYEKNCAYVMKCVGKAVRMEVEGLKKGQKS